jgi:hypothetical protein
MRCEPKSLGSTGKNLGTEKSGYIHPYAAQDEGLSWASIKDNGTWQIQTVQRQFKSDQMAALLVERTYTEPNKLEKLESIAHKAIVIKDLRGTPDYGKL